MTIFTLVSASNPIIKKIIATSVQATVPGSAPWKGRRVTIEQVDEGWTYQLYNDTGEPFVYQGKADGSSMRRVPTPKYAGPPTIITAPAPNGEIVVVHQRFGGNSISIVIPQLDAATLDVARDAWMLGDAAGKKAAKATLQHLGPYTGIALAIIESQSDSLAQAVSGKTSRQLDREIDDYLESRKASHLTRGRP